jgi:hypothetical protein
MLVSEKIGGLPIVSSIIFDHGWLAAYLAMFAADFGVIVALMLCEGTPPWERSHYKTFLWNDTIWIPLYLATATYFVSAAGQYEGFFTQTWWHALLFVLGFAVSIFIEVGAVKNEQYTISQELSPSKLWHTFIFGVVFYWMLSILIPFLAALYASGSVIGWLLFAATVAGFFFNAYRDAVLPFPKNAHLEGTYVPWNWYPRNY